MNTRKVKIMGTGKYLPQQVVTAEDLGKKIGVDAQWIIKKSGVKKRHFVVNETVAQMGAMAAQQALDAAQLTLADIDAVVSAGGVMQQAIPCTAALIQRELGCEGMGIPAFDINSTCLGFLTALDTLSYQIQDGRFRHVLIVCSDIASAGLNWEHHESCTLFGDGAAAVVVGLTPQEEQSAIIASCQETYCEGADLCRIQGGGSGLPSRFHQPGIDVRFLFEMDGQAIFKMASKMILPFVEKLIWPNHLDSIDLLIPHQASAMALRILQKKLNLPDEKMMLIVEDHGNVIAASLPMALHEAIKQNRLKRGQKVMMLGTSAGFSIGGMILEY